MPSTTITIEQRSPSNSSSRSNSLTDEEGSSGTGVHVSSAVGSQYSDGTDETWDPVYADEIEPSDSASRPRTSNRYRESDRPPPARRELPSRRHTTTERSARRPAETRLHRQPVPRPPSSVDPSDDFPGYGRGYAPPPASHYGGAARPPPQGYAPTSFSSGYAPPFNDPRAVIPFGHQGAGYGQYSSQNPFTPSPQPPAQGAGYFAPHGGMHGMSGQVSSPYGGAPDMISYHSSPYGYTPDPRYMHPTGLPHPGMLSHAAYPFGWPAADAESEAEKKLAEMEKMMKEQQLNAEKTLKEQLEAAEKAKKEQEEATAKLKKEQDEAAAKAKKEADEAVVQARKEVEAKALAEREAEKAAARAAEEKAAADKKAIEEAVAKAREKFIEKQAAEKKAAAKKADEEAEAAAAAAKAAEEQAAAEKKAIEDAVAKAKAEMESKMVYIKEDDKKKPIKFKDAVGRKFSFPFHLCQTWAGMEELIKQAFLHVDIIGPHVAEGHYDLIGPHGEIILPQVWETMIEPDWAIEMRMWPMPEPRPGPPPGPVPFDPRHPERHRRSGGRGPPPGPTGNNHRGGPPPLPANWPGARREGGPGPGPTIEVVHDNEPRSSKSGGGKKKAPGGVLSWIGASSKPKPSGKGKPPKKT